MQSLLISTVVLFASVTAIGNPHRRDGCAGGQGKAKCPPGYELKKREHQRQWCLKYFPGNYTFFEAENVCRCQGGASLSGIENMNELMWVIEKAENSFQDSKIENGGIWVGAYRRQGCRQGKIENKTECSRVNQYQWTDRNTIGSKMWQTRWTEGAPHTNKAGEFCVQVQVSINPALANQNLTGYFDNRVCGNPDSPIQFPTEGFVCGRPAVCVGGTDGYSDGYSGGWFIGAGKPTNLQPKPSN